MNWFGSQYCGAVGPNALVASSTDGNRRCPFRYARRGVPNPPRNCQRGRPAVPRFVVITMTPPDAFEP